MFFLTIPFLQLYKILHYRGDEPMFPIVPQALLEELERRFPDRMPDSLNTDELLRKQGNVQVVRFLRKQFDTQNQTVLDPKHV